MKISPFLNRLCNVSTVLVIALSTVLVSDAVLGGGDFRIDFIFCEPFPPEGGETGECEPVATAGSSLTCCPCNQTGIPIVPNPCFPVPPEPPVILTTPDPPQPPDPECGSDEDKQSVGGKPTLVGSNEFNFKSAIRLERITDLGFGANSGGCAGCGSGGNGGGSPVYFPAVGIARRLMPANRTELFSFGRGMASEFDLRLTFYPNTTNGYVALLYDPRLELEHYLTDSNVDGTYELENNNYYESIKLTNGASNPVTNPAIAAAPSQIVYATVTRRNGWSYKLQVCFNPSASGTFYSKLLYITNPQGQALTFTYPPLTTITYAQINSSPELQLQIATIKDIQGNTAAITYHTTQKGGLWVISNINLNGGEETTAYTYSSNGLLETVTRGSEVSSTYAYGMDTTYNLATLTWNERGRNNHSSNDTLLLSPDYQNGNGTVVNQFANILQGRRNGNGQVKSMIYRDQANAGWYKVLNEGTMSEIKLGQQERYYTSFTNNGSGYAGITGTQENMYPLNGTMTAAQLAKSQPPTDRDETGYTVTNTYDSAGNLTQVTHPGGTYEKWLYTTKNAVRYYRDRAGFVTVTERDGNQNVIRVIRGMTDASGSGTPTATTEAVQDIYGYYDTGGIAGALAWQATNAYSGTTFSAPAASDRTDYLYNTNTLPPLHQLVKTQQPIPIGQTARPEVQFTWVGNHKATEVSQLGHTTTYSYDVLGRLIETLYADGTKTQTRYDDVNFTVYQKDRLNVVSADVYGLSGRKGASYQAWGRDVNLADGTLDSLNSVNEYVQTLYSYVSGASQPTNVTHNSAVTTTTYDYRGRAIGTVRKPRDNMSLESWQTYVDNQRFYSTSKTGTHEIRTYFGYSADRQTVRTIETRKPGVTFADNTAVLNTTRLTTADPDFIINDAVRDIRGQIVQLTDPNGIQSQTSYDALGRSLVQTRTKGALTLSNQSTYDADGNVTQSISETGLVTNMTYDQAGNLATRVVAPGTSLAATWSYTYAIDGRPATVTEPNNGVTTSIFQTCCGFTTGTKNALGHGSVTNRDSQGRSVHAATLEDFVSHTNLLDPLNSKTLSETTTKYRDDGRVKFQTVWKAALGAVDRNNPPIAGVNGIAVADGLTTQYVYDSVISDGVGLDSTAGLTITRLGGATAAISIQAAKTKLADTIANGGAGTVFGVVKGVSGRATVVIAPDEKTMQVSITDATGRGVMNATMTGPAATTPNTLINWTCTLADQIDTTTTSIAALKTSSIDPAGKQTSAITDGYGRTVASIDQLGNITQQSYDSGGNLLKSTDALTRETNFVYDGLGRQTTVTAPLSNVRTTVYSPANGLVTSRTDAKGVSTSYGYDLLSRVLTTTDRTGKLTTNTYNTAGQLASITDAQAKVTTYIYNLLGQRTSTTLPDNTAKAMTYDPAGRLKKSTLASGKSQTNVYEFSGVLDKIEFRNAANTLVGTDDYTYDALLRKTGSTGRYSVTQAWVYNDLGQLATDTTTYSGQSYAVNFAYDTRGRMNTITYPSGRVAAYTFTDRSELDKINWAGSQIEDRAYDAVGLLTGVDRPGVDETRAYDALNRVTSIGNTNVGDGTYTYDANSNKLSESWSGAMAAWNFITTNAGANPTGYDAEDRFTNFIQSGQSKTLGLTRSDIGNISNINLNGTNTARGYSNIHALTSIGSANQVFDTDGNLTNAQTGIDLAWDEAGMMKETIVGTGDTAGIEGTNTYGYDADRKRVWKKRMLESSTNEHTVYIHAGPNVIAEYPAGTAAASPTQEYVYGQEIDSLVLLVRTGGTEKLTITRNQQWSVTALSDAASGSVLERYTYDHFGKRTILEPNGSTVRASSSYNMPFGYTSRQHDAETGLLFMRARYYDHLTAEFISPDPLEYVDGLSLYRSYFVPGGVDPWGLKWKVERNGGEKAGAVPGDRNDTIDDLAKLIGLNGFEYEAWLTTKDDNGMPFPGLNDPIGWTYCDLPEFQVPNTIYAVWAGEEGSLGAFFVCFADEILYLRSLGFNVLAPENYNDTGALVGPSSIDYYNELENLSSNKKIHGLYGMGHGNTNYFFYGRRMGINTVWIDEERIYNYKTSMSKLKYHLGFTLINACYSKSGATLLTSSIGISDGHVGVLDPTGTGWFGDSGMIWAENTIFHGDQETK